MTGKRCRNKSRQCPANKPVKVRKHCRRRPRK